MFRKNTIDEYLKALSSKSPVPGGGSGAALIGATGCALLSKTLNFTVGKKKYAAAQKEMSDIFAKTEAIQENMIKLCSQDAVAYRKLSDAMKASEKGHKLETALREAISVPLEICKNSRDAIKLCLPVAKKGNINLLTDTAIAGIALKCAFESARLNVEINLKHMKDTDFILSARKTLELMEKETCSINKEIDVELKKHLSEGRGK